MVQPGEYHPDPHILNPNLYDVNNIELQFYQARLEWPGRRGGGGGVVFTGDAWKTTAGCGRLRAADDCDGGEDIEDGGLDLDGGGRSL